MTLSRSPSATPRSDRVEFETLLSDISAWLITVGSDRAAAALWLDDLTRDLLDGGTLKGYIEELFFDIALEDIGRASTWTPSRPACRLGRKKWQKRGETVTKRFVSPLLLDDVVLGGGNAKKLTRLPMGCRMGDDANAFLGGCRLWEKTTE